MKCQNAAVMPGRRSPGGTALPSPVADPGSTPRRNQGRRLEFRPSIPPPRGGRARRREPVSDGADGKADSAEPTGGTGARAGPTAQEELLYASPAWVRQRVEPLHRLPRADQRGRTMRESLIGTRQLRNQMLRRLPTKAELERRTPIVLTERDKSILVAIYTHGFLTTELIEVAFFPPPAGGRQSPCSQAYERLQRLWEWVVCGTSRTADGSLARRSSAVSLCPRPPGRLDRGAATIPRRLPGPAAPT